MKFLKTRINSTLNPSSRLRGTSLLKTIGATLLLLSILEAPSIAATTPVKKTKASATKKTATPAPAPTPATAADYGLTLHQAVSAALQNNPLLRETNEKITQAETELPIARALVYPNLSAVVGGDRAKDSVINGNANFSGDP